MRGALMAKVDSLQEHRSNQSIDMEILIKNQKEMLEMKKQGDSN